MSMTRVSFTNRYGSLERLLHYSMFLEDVLFWTIAKSIDLESSFT